MIDGLAKDRNWICLRLALIEDRVGIGILPEILALRATGGMPIRLRTEWATLCRDNGNEWTENTGLALKSDCYISHNEV